MLGPDGRKGKATKCGRHSEKPVSKIEMLKFRKNCPKLLPSVHRELDQLVRSELEIHNVDVDAEQLNPVGSEPKLGLNVERIIAPPIVECRNCKKLLTKNK